MRIALTVPAEDAERALTLGALFDEKAGTYFAPAGMELARFQAWLPAGTSTSALTIPSRGISLTQLLTRVSEVVNATFSKSEWVKLEIATLRASGGHLYFDAVDRTADGRELSKARAVVWASIAERLGKKFFDATGARLENGMKILVLAKAQFHPQHSFTLTISDIDPDYTLGDMQAKLKRIREALQAAGIADRNKRLAAPADFTHVAVVAPENAAGLEDFEVEARRLQAAGLCRFTYFHATFQGENTKTSLKQAIIDAHTCHTEDRVDALVIIRGGGATTDLQWLNEEILAKMVCRFHVPVITGIGHERDSTILDECAHKSIGTPSKVIHYIREVIATRASRAWEDWQLICQMVQTRLAAADATVAKIDTDVRTLANTRIDRATHAIEQDMQRVQHGATGALNVAAERTEQHHANVVQRASATIAMADKNVDHLSLSIQDQALNAVQTIESQTRNHFDAVLLAARRSIDGISEHLDEVRLGILSRAETIAQRMSEDSERHFADVRHFANRMLDNATAGTEDTFATIMAYGVERTLKRGFTMVLADGRPVTSKAEAAAKQELTIRFKDGSLNVSPKGE